MWEIIHQTPDLQQAHVYRTRLEAEGIPAVVVPRRTSLYTFANPLTGEYELRVPLELAPKALMLLRLETDPAPDEQPPS